MALGTTAPNCCCTIFSDGFYGTSLRPLTWNVDSGTWTVASNVLSTSSASAQINLLPSAGAALNALKAPFLMQACVSLAAGCDYRFYCGGNYVDILCYNISSNPYVTIKLVVNGVTVTVPLALAGGFGTYTIAICWTTSGVVVNAYLNANSNVGFAASTNEGLSSSATWGPGVGTGPSNTATCNFYGLIGVGPEEPVVGFSLSRMGIAGYNTSGIPITCPGCPGCTVCSGTTPAEWQAVVSGTNLHDAGFNGTYILVGGASFAAGSPCQWNYDLADGTGGVQFLLEPPPAGGAGASLAYFELVDAGAGLVSHLGSNVLGATINCTSSTPIVISLSNGGSVSLTPIVT